MNKFDNSNIELEFKARKQVKLNTTGAQLAADRLGNLWINLNTFVS